MKKVVSPGDVAHLFAHQTQPEATNSGRTFFFNGDSIYSYGRHFCIARFHNGRLLFTKRTYSNTTSKHVSMTWSACYHHEKVMCYHPEDRTGLRNFEFWEWDINKELSKLGRARKREIYLRNIHSLINEVKVYAEFMDLEIPEKLRAMVYSSDIESMLSAEASKIREIEDAQKATRMAEYKERVQKFKAFEIDHIGMKVGDYDHLRVSESGFETSQGIKLELLEGIDLYRCIKAGLLKRGDRIKHYIVNSVDSKVLVVGCHKILISEIDSVAQYAINTFTKINECLQRH